MREILFRGKNMYGEWVKGDLAHSIWITGDCYIQGRDHFDMSYSFAVDPASVGQYTGIRDKNDNPIFEGDILSAYLDDSFPDNETQAVVFWDEKRLGWGMNQPGFGADPLEPEDGSTWAVVGNIFDDPKLLP